MKTHLIITFLAFFSINCTTDDNDGFNCEEQIWYQDSDEDGFGDPSISLLSCEQPEGYVADTLTTIKEAPIEAPIEVVEDNKDPLLTFTKGTQEIFFINETDANYGFYLFTPTEYEENENNKYPLLIHLHGGGARGAGNSESSMSRIIFDGPPSLIRTNSWNPSEPMIVVSPQSPHLWDPNRLHKFIDYLIINLNIDISRIYMTGLSMGGRGIFDYITKYGDLSHTVAVVPIAGWSDINNGKPFKNIALWAFHGGADPVVNVSGSIDMVNAINENTPTVRAKLTIFPGVNHFSWSRVYSGSGIGTEDVNYDPFDITIYDWMLLYSKQ